MDAELNGPYSYKNWMAWLKNQPCKRTVEYPLFTDAHIVGDRLQGLGPYLVINNVSSESNRPGLTLRVQEHIGTKLSNMDKTQDQHYHGGFEADEIAALLSLCLGIRVKAGLVNRVFGEDSDPMGRPMGGIFYEDPDITLLRKKDRRFILKNAIKTHTFETPFILDRFPRLSLENANALVLAARLYQEAIWIVETTPELSWIMLTSAVETVAAQWRSSIEPPLETLRLALPNVEEILRQYGGEELALKIAEQIAQYMGATRKFTNFLLEFLPEPPSTRPPSFAQHSWEKPTIKKTLTQIYNYRSRALHGGIPFPKPMCEPAWESDHRFAEIPIALAASIGSSVWINKDVPMLLNTYEYIVRNAILNWWRNITKENLIPI